jgi:monoamine oxidase
VEKLRAGLDPARVQVRLGSPVAEVRWERGSVEMRCSRAARYAVFRASRAIVTAPIGVLQLPPEAPGAIRFVPDVPDVRRAAEKLGSGPVVKVVMVFSEPFWETPAAARAAGAGEELRDASFLHAPGAPFPTWWTQRPLRVPMLTGWSGGPRSLRLSGVPRQAVVKAALESLAALFRQRASRLGARLVSAHTHDWPSDPFARGAYSYVLVGGMSARARLARPVESTLFFAGEAADAGGNASTVAGALASGRRAAEDLIASARD